MNYTKQKVRRCRMTKVELIDWALNRGWWQDKYGHLQKQINDKQYRLKLSTTAVRYEVRVKYDSGGSSWVRLSSGYYKDLSVSDDNKLVGLRRGI